MWCDKLGPRVDNDDFVKGEDIICPVRLLKNNPQDKSDASLYTLHVDDFISCEKYMHNLLPPPYYGSRSAPVANKAVKRTRKSTAVDDVTTAPNQVAEDSIKRIRVLRSSASNHA